MHLVPHKIRNNLSTFVCMYARARRERENEREWCVEDVANDDDNNYDNDDDDDSNGSSTFNTSGYYLWNILFVQLTDDIIVNQSCFSPKVSTIATAHIQLNFPSLLLYFVYFLFSSIQCMAQSNIFCVFSFTSFNSQQHIIIVSICSKFDCVGWHMMDWAEENNLKMSVVIVLDCYEWTKRT